MKPKRYAMVATSIVLLSVAASTTVSHADEPDNSVPATTEAPPPTTAAPRVTVTVEDVPVTNPPATDPPSTQPDTTQPKVLDDPKPPAVTTTTVDTPTTTEATPETGTTTDPTTTTTTEAPKTSLAASTEVGVVPSSSTTSTLNPNQNTSDQSANVGGTLVADGNTGGNLTHNDTASGSSVPGADINSGGATAVGSDDTNKVVQGADVVLTDQAIANVLQVALVLNIGAALANSGANGVAAGPGGTGATGAIGTGDATATGLDMSQYITQAAKAQGDANTDDAAKQLAVSLWMGIGLANTGVNAVDGTGGTGSGGTVDSGDSTATGNHSLTDILQGAAVNGSGTSQTDIAQYATVLNLGFALANSGANNIAGVASSLLTAGDSQEQNDMAVDLFSMLLPALMSTYATSAGSGAIDTGNATAIGNDSQTYIKQIAEAANSGDGIASIIQSVLVANAGAAGANTGGNELGGTFASLDPQQAKAVVTLAAFLSQMLALVHTQANDQAQQALSQGLDIPFGDIVLQVQGAMQGVDTTLGDTTGTGTGPVAHVRQVTIVLSLGWAQANSGLNAALAANGDPGAVGLMSSNDLAAGVNNGTLDQIRTANAAGVNQGLVIICQRRNADDIACLAPPDPPADDPSGDDPSTPPTTTVVPLPDAPIDQAPDALAPGPIVVATQGVSLVDPAEEPQTPSGFLQVPTATATSSHGTGSLPFTGADSDDMLQIATWIVGVGSFAFVITRRRRKRV